MDRSKLARELGAVVVELDLSTPFTAARARNAGFSINVESRRTLNSSSSSMAIAKSSQDGSPAPSQTFSGEPKASVVCGRRRERHPRASIYNTLCDIEWNTPIGKTRACGGDAMIRAEAFHASQRIQPLHHRRRRTGDVRPPPRRRLGNPPHRCRDDPARCRDDEILAMVETHAALRTRLRRRLRDARRATGMTQRQTGSQHLDVGTIPPGRLRLRGDRHCSVLSPLVLDSTARIRDSIRC